MTAGPRQRVETSIDIKRPARKVKKGGIIVSRGCGSATKPTAGSA